ncbi:MAG: Hsp20/alpha crystallin family protein, partial [Patescibacteria group bacterium]
VSTIAGTISDRVEVYVQSDVLTIRGERRPPLDGLSHVRYFYQECYWGRFSRTVILPMHVKGELASAEYRNGVLTVRMPKQTKHHPVPIVVVEE